jgi:predicted lipase
MSAEAHFAQKAAEIEAISKKLEKEKQKIRRRNAALNEYEKKAHIIHHEALTEVNQAFATNQQQQQQQQQQLTFGGQDGATSLAVAATLASGTDTDGSYNSCISSVGDHSFVEDDNDLSYHSKAGKDMAPRIPLKRDR